MSSKAIEQLLTENNHKLSHLPYSKCRNCDNDLRLFEGKWYHVEMWASTYHLVTKCKRAYPQRCKNCGGRIDYTVQDATYYDFLCQDCIEWDKKGDRIGELTKEMKKKIETQTVGHSLKYGYIISAVITKHGIFFIDIA